MREWRLHRGQKRNISSGKKNALHTETNAMVRPETDIKYCIKMLEKKSRKLYKFIAEIHLSKIDVSAEK